MGLSPDNLKDLMATNGNHDRVMRGGREVSDRPAVHTTGGSN